jgi:hypothetical protein
MTVLIEGQLNLAPEDGRFFEYEGRLLSKLVFVVCFLLLLFAHDVEILFPVATKLEQQQCATKYRYSDVTWIDFVIVSFLFTFFGGDVNFPALNARFILCNQTVIVAKLKANSLDGPVRIFPLKKLQSIAFTPEDSMNEFTGTRFCSIIYWNRIDFVSWPCRVRDCSFQSLLALRFLIQLAKSKIH